MQMIKRAKNISWTKIGETTVILDSREKKVVHELNSVASDFWALLDTPTRLQEIQEKLIKIYHIDKDTLQNDLESLLTELQDKNLITLL